MSHRRIEVWSKRNGEPVLVRVIGRVPVALTNAEIIKRYGLRDHLTVYEIIAGYRQCIQIGKEGTPKCDLLQL